MGDPADRLFWAVYSRSTGSPVKGLTSLMSVISRLASSGIQHPANLRDWGYVFADWPAEGAGSRPASSARNRFAELGLSQVYQ